MSENEEGKPESMVGALRVLTELTQRNIYARMLGKSFDDKRDIYAALGYKKDLEFADYWNVFKRGRLGKRIINAPVESTWRGDVEIYEDEEEKDTPFEIAWDALVKKHHIFSKFKRLDTLVGIADFALLLLGFSDNKKLGEPLVPMNGMQLIYVQPYSFGSIQVVQWEDDETNPRYGLPVMYTIAMTTVGSISGSTTPSGSLGKVVRVHHSRVIHVADGLLDNDVIGTPRLESVFNGLQDLEKVAGGSAEMFWQGGLGGKAFSSKEGATIDAQSKEDMTEQIDDYVHGLRRYLRLQNMDVNDLSPQVTDPSQAISAQLDLISGDTGIPKRILIGSERGELASTQDESNWLNRIKERRTQYAEPCILRPVIDLLLLVGVLPPLQNDDYHIEWPDLWSSSEQEQALVSKTMTEALAAYMNAPGADQVVPVDFFLEEVLKFSPEQIDRIKEILGVGAEESIEIEPPEPPPVVVAPTQITAPVKKEEIKK